MTLRSVSMVAAVGPTLVASGGFGGGDPIPLLGLARIELGGRAEGVESADLDHDGDTDLVFVIRDMDMLRVALNNGAGSFDEIVDLPIGDESIGARIGDLNNDTHPDIVVCSQNDHEISVILGNGDGTFGARTVLSATFAPNYPALGDIDNDGDVDIVATLFQSDRIGMFFNNGDGTFAPEVRVSAGNAPRDIELHDIDSDGDLDAIYTIVADDAVGIMLNDGSGAFVLDSTFAVGDYPIALDLADLDNDGDSDLVVANADGERVAVCEFESGVFGAPVLIPMPVSNYDPTDIRAVDLDGDGVPELVAPNQLRDTITILSRGMDGVYAIDRLIHVNDGPRTIGVLDLDNDGDTDLAIAHIISDDVVQLVNMGDGVFTNEAASDINWTLGKLLGADMDNDGEDELVGSGNGGIIWVLEGDGEGCYERSFFGDLTNTASDFTIGRFDNDVYPDVAAGIQSIFMGPNVNILEDDQGSGFEPRTSASAGTDPLEIISGRIDSNARDDLVVRSVQNITVLPNSSGSFPPLQSVRLTIDDTSAIALGDIDGDGDNDLLVGTELGQILVYENSNGDFAPSGELGAVGFVDAIEIIDTNDDGTNDLLIGIRDDNSVRVLIGQGDGLFSDAQTLDPGSGFARVQMETGDLDDDGDPDLVVRLFGSGAGSSDRVSVYTNDGGVFGLMIGSTFVDGFLGLTMIDADDDGDLDIAYSDPNFDEIRVVLNETDPVGCPPDLVEDDSLDLLDLGTLLAGFIDYNEDGVFDFFDISAFLSDVAEGCP